ncbi:MAG: alcohol dehydrogenase catalytic domain-containing protein [Chloroflexota bacterium]|nr:MAG: alcohol dehydrogenase catalytic domain-containing protein [Chloroflexota bacterium]
MKGVAKITPGEGNVALIDAPEPQVLPQHVLIEVKAAGICGTDLHIYHDEFKSTPPVIMGHEVAGVVVEVGEGVESCRPGDRVTSETYFYVCGQCQFCREGFINLCPSRRSIGSRANGAFTRYLLVPQQNIHPLPDSVDEQAGALTEPLACCVRALELTRVEPGETAVISGPGAIGLLMMQVVKAAGARVIVLGTNADEARLEKAAQMGADFAFNVQTTDTLTTIREMTNGLGADVVFECAGAAPSAQHCLDLVRRQGRYAQVGLFGKPIAWDLEQVCYKELKVSGSNATVPSAWRKAVALLANGQVQVGPLISHVLPISEWQHAFNLFEQRQGHKIILTPIE